MLHALLVIFKILMWIILAILGLVLLVILLVLFSPIKYKIDAKYHKTAVVRAKISFLIASVGILFEQETKRFDYNVRLLGIKLKLGKEKNPKKVSKPVAITDDHPSVEKAVDKQNEHSNLDNKVDDIDNINDIDDIEEFDLFDGELDKDVPKEHRSLMGRIKAFFVGVRNKIANVRHKAAKFSPENIEEKIESKVAIFKKTTHKIKRFWNLKCTVKTRNYLKRYLIGLIKHIGPRSIKGYVRYGFGDPCKTGQITGYLSLLPFVYSKHFSLEPNFYDKIIDTELLIKGKIRIGYILRIVLNINIWRTILVARKIFKGKKKEV